MICNPEITWSLMHPTRLDPDYFRRVLQAAEARRVDSFEICGPCHGLESGLDGLIDYAPYRDASRHVDKLAVEKRQRSLNEILELSHTTERPVYYWHRETVVPPGIVEDRPGLLLREGIFDFFGDEYAALLRYKIDQALAACPLLDGVVLTLTEAQYSVIHPPTDAGVDPREVVRHIVTLMADDLHSRGKKLILRSFGSIDEDYRTILSGAERAAREVSFEIETKATPFDFIPYFDDNPHLHLVPGCSLSVECDGLGEFLGAGYFPAHGIEDLIRRVAAGRRVGCSRYVLRIDRCGQSILDSSYEHKLDVFESAVMCGGDEARRLAAEYSERLSPGEGERLLKLMETGWQATLQTLFVRGNLIFHTNPVAPRLKWLKAGGFFGVLGNQGSLARLHGIWSIMSDRPAPTQEEILEEKQKAVSLVSHGERLLKELSQVLEPELRDRLTREWNNLGLFARAMEKFIRFSNDMVHALQNREPLSSRFEVAVREYESAFGLSLPKRHETDSDAIETDLFATRSLPVEDAWLVPIGRIMVQMLADYEVEFRQRELLFALPGVVDVLIPGGLADDNRTGRIMHASHAFLEGNRLARAVGNRLFPEAELEFELRLPTGSPVELTIETGKNTPPVVKHAGRTLPVMQEGPSRFRVPVTTDDADRIFALSFPGGHGNVFSISVASAPTEQVS